MSTGKLPLPLPSHAALDGLAIRDGRASCAGPISSLSGGGLEVFSGSSVTVSNMLFLSNTSVSLGGGVLVAAAQLSLDHAAFLNNSADAGGGMGVTGGLSTGSQVTVTASSFVGNLANDGGAISLRPAGGTVRLTSVDTHYSDNRAEAGGAVEAHPLIGLVELSFDGDQFLDNQANPGDGGAIVATGAGLTINNTTFTSNDSPQSAGGAVHSQGVVTVTETMFLSNTARTSAGALAVFGTLNMQGGGFRENSTSETNFSAVLTPVGGGVFVSGTAAITGTRFTTNTAFLRGLVDNMAGGGGLAVIGSLTLSEAEFRGNTARQGGAVQVFGSAAISRSLFEENSASDGGGVFADGGLTLDSNWLIDNFVQQVPSLFQPSRGGGVLLLHGGAAGRIANNLFLGNRAFASTFVGGTGSALFIDGAATVVSDNTIVGRVVTGTAASVTGTTTLFNNIITSHTLGIEHRGGAVTEDYNLFFGNTATRSLTVTPGGHSQTANPRFVNPAQDDFRLNSDSPGLDAGDNSAVPFAITTDLDGGPRIVDSPAADTGSGPPPIVDIGAYELDNRFLFLPVVHR
jgi:hypothetical protein